MTLTRRSLLLGGLGVLGVAAVGGCGASWAPGETGRLLPSAVPLPPRFGVPLPIPTTAPVTREGDHDVVTIRQEPAELELLPGIRTRVQTYGGSWPGPVIESRQGRPLVVRHTNALDIPTVVHLHGGHTPSDSDGWPTDLVEPGQTRDYRYPGTQRAAMLWYHDHAMDRTGPNVYAGLFGVHLVRDDEEDALDLPRGEREIPLVIADRSFSADGQLVYPMDLVPEDGGHGGHGGQHGGTGHVDPRFIEGLLGDVLLTNGAAWPVLAVDAARYRFRILNACNARRLELALDPPPPGGAGFAQIGSDGGLLAEVVRHDTLPVAQAERFDVIIDFSRYPVGTEIVLANRLGSASDDAVLKFVVARAGSDPSAPVDQLSAALPPIEPLVSAGTPVRLWRFGRGIVEGGEGWAINGRLFDPKRMDAEVPLGRVERWQFLADVHHPVHVHLDPFQVLSRGGNDPARTDAGWKDTVSLRPGEMVEVAVRFTDYAGPFLIHCHNLEHEDRMMMAAFSTVTN